MFLLEFGRHRRVFEEVLVRVSVVEVLVFLFVRGWRGTVGGVLFGFFAARFAALARFTTLARLGRLGKNENSLTVSTKNSNIPNAFAKPSLVATGCPGSVSRTRAGVLNTDASAGSGRTPSEERDGMSRAARRAQPPATRRQAPP